MRTTREKLALHDESEARNEERRKTYMQTVGVHTALEIHAKAILDSLDVLAGRYHLKRDELLDELISTLYATDQCRAQEDKGNG